MMKKKNWLAFSILSLSLLASCGSSNKVTIADKSVKAYMLNTQNSIQTTLHFVNGVDDVPYFDADTALKLYASIMSQFYSSTYSLSLTKESETYTLSRENGSSLALDFKSKQLVYHDFDGFFSAPYAETKEDVAGASGFNNAGEPSFLQRDPASSSYRGGESVITIPLGERGIPTYYQNDMGYLPVATFSDFFFSPYSLFFLYNGVDLYFANDFSNSALRASYYSVPTRSRSEELSQFTYSEFTLCLDTFFGLKKEKNITSFDSFLNNCDLKKDLLNTDPMVEDKALASLAWSYLGDGHTKYVANSPYAGNAITFNSYDYGSYEWADLCDRVSSIKKIRAATYPDGIPSYEVVGNTAFLSFDEFIYSPDDARYYSDGPTAKETDTTGLVAYAHKQILANPTIKNVVMDLSCNTGGMADAAIYTSAWFLGTSHINLLNTVSGSLAMNGYRADTNLDRKFDENDTLSGKKLFCLTSRSSFSCGNLVPCTFKGSGKVSLVGETSGGGSCVVTMLALADGTVFRISGSRHLQRVYNGTSYDIDQGATPDYPISDLNFLFENKRLNLVAYLNTLH
jgi:hypothetical protein